MGQIEPVDTVGASDREAGSVAARHLVEPGQREIVCYL
jgi:DNA-binding LacI/PurR family transcriptional regulator